ncbi:MAG TPA: hypothetical protein VFA97_03260 [Gaiellaceae bacterium]|nr:hypothetical protein [Gaiellaceae bacterium]
MIWLGWRQQRTETVITAALLGFVAAFLVPTGIEMAHAYAHDGLANCLGLNTGPACGDAVSAFELRFSKFTGLVGWFNLVPGLFGVVLAAPYVLELEHGTHRLAWTQSITRFQWVRAKLALAITSTLVAAAALIALYTWWRVPFVHLDGRMDNGAFDAQGTVVLGYALFALGLALAVGAVWRRGIPAVLVSFVGYFVARIFVDTWLRQRFIAPKQLTFSSGRGDPPALWHAWIISEGPSNAQGGPAVFPRGGCVAHAQHGFRATKACMASLGGHVHALFEPASRFWALQGIETALFAGVGVTLIAFAGWWTLRSE